MLGTSIYIQKSQLMLYPLLGLAFNTEFKPICTYTSYKGINHSDCKLICVYKTEHDEAFYKFRNEVLKKNPYYESLILTLNTNIVIFNLSEFRNDWNNFLLGKYSKFSVEAKLLIKQFYSHSDLASTVIESHIEPEEFHEIYAELYEVSKEVIVDNFETLTPPDLKKEELVV